MQRYGQIQQSTDWYFLFFPENRIWFMQIVSYITYMYIFMGK